MCGSTASGRQESYPLLSMALTLFFVSVRFRTLSESETAVSEFETNDLESETAISDSETTVSESETAISDSETTVSESETAHSESDTLVSESEWVRKRKQCVSW